MDSKAYYVSSHNAVRDAATATFVVNVQNAIYVNKAVKVCPMSVTLPNIFPNVTKYNNTFSESDGGPTPVTRTIPIGQYTLTELVTAFNAASTRFTMAVSAAGMTTMTAGTPGDRLQANIDFIHLFGLQGWVAPSSSTIYESQTDNHTSVVPVNIGGEKLVHLICNQLASAHCIHAVDGTPYDVVAHISLHDVPYGFDAHWRASDVVIDNVAYKDHVNLDTLRIQLLDHQFRPLTFPDNYHVRMMLKIFHQDGMMGKNM